MLFLENYVHNEQQTLKDFLFHFFVDYNEDYDTVDRDGNLQTEKGKSRSLGDITEIVNSYYPDTPRDTVKEVLLDFGSDLVGHYCGDIRKRVYSHRATHPYWEQCSTDKKDEYGDIISYKK
jgi:hypothetical protein